MAEWVWEARTRAGEQRRGTMEADSDATVVARLRSQQLSPVRVKKKPKELNIVIGRGVSDAEIVTFVRQFATMIDAGLPLVQCLEILGSQTPNKHFAGILREIKTAVEGGSTFSDALRKHPKIFDELFVNLIAAGEMGGILDTILNRLAGYIEKAVKLRRQVVGAMVYPSAILIVAILVISVLMVWVIPNFEEMFRAFPGSSGEADLPKLTAIVIGISRIFASNFLLAIIAFGAGFAGFLALYRSPKGKEFFHRLVLNLPIVGTVINKVAVARFSRTMATLLSSGVPILDAMDIVAKSAGNVVVEKALRYTRDRISEGKSMAEPLSEQKVFPPMVVQMIGVGEQTGALDTMLNKIADFYDDEVDVAVAAMTRLMEPVMMVFIGGVVGVIIISMYLPIFDMAGRIKVD